MQTHCLPIPMQEHAPRTWLLIAMIGLCAAQSIPLGRAAAADLSPGLSKTQTDMTVHEVNDRGPYIEARLDMSGKDFFAYALIGDDCRSIFQPGAKVTYIDSGPLGEFERAGFHCQVLGVGNLRIWRDRKVRSASQLAPRSQASYQLIHRDDDVALLRGTFPQAARLGFSGSSDLIAIVPVSEVCEGPIASGTASIEYRPKGKRVLSLVGKNGLCDLRGLAQPPPQAKRREPVKATEAEVPAP
ncbi:MAG: hypothetical protein JRG92_02580 [Deltaproteobacteria bacterium]|nr:hypothetical protein [Deltaproteobacteria bacterium]MBW2382488.1 hypothetical protein [Deltaproteobacteria bacterium]MBW2694969.1 hypothetical protein [Deltaproteobacteria bacterium]